MKKSYYFIFIIFLISLSSFTGCKPSHPITKLKIIRKGDKIYYGKGWKEKRDKLTIVHLEGSPYEMGYQQGILLKDEIKGMMGDYREEAKRLITNWMEQNLPKFLTKYRNEKLDNITESIGIPIFYYIFVRRAEKYIPEEFIEEMKGLSDAANINYYSVIIGNVGYDLLENFFCTSFSAGPPATKDNKLLHGRNLDWWPPELVSKTTTVFFIKPDKGYPFVSIANAGSVGVTTGMNTEGITISINASSCKKSTLDGFPVLFLLKKVIQYSSNLEDGIKIITDNKRTVGVNILITDGKIKKAKIVEFSPKKYTIREMHNGSIFTTNHYVSQNMKKEQKFPPDVCYRYERLKTLFKKNYKNIDIEKMIEFLRDRYDYQTGKIDCYGFSINNSGTAQSIIFSPTDLNFWVSNKKSAYSCDGEYIGFNLKDEFNLTKKKIINYEENPYLKTNGYKSFLHYEKGCEYLKDKKLKNAELEFKKAIELDPDNASLYQRLGEVNFYPFKKYNLAIKYYNKAIELLDPNNRYSSLDEIYDSVGEVYLYNKDFNKAISNFKRVFNYNPSKNLKIRTYFRSGIAYDCLGERKKAISFYKKALELKPESKWIKRRIKKYIEKPFNIKELK